MGGEFGPAAIVRTAVEEALSEGKDEGKYISPSSLARGCMLYVAREILGFPKPPLEPRIRRMFEVGIEGHRRIERYLRRISLAQEVFFQDDRYRIKGYCDALVFIPPSLSEEHSGLYAVEIKTTGSWEFGRIEDEGPREDHRRQLMIYIWGLERYYGLPIRGGIIFYEDRDSLEHRLFDVAYDELLMEELLRKVERMWEALREGHLPDDHPPLDHWVHRYCPYLDICEVGKEALEYQREHRKELPEEVLARIIGERIVRKRRREGERRKKKRERSLEELAAELGWE